MQKMLTRNGTDGRVYGGDTALVHIADGTRRAMGETVADYLDYEMRHSARVQGKNAEGLLCPGCTMIALFNAAVKLAEDNGQPLTELGRTMSAAFAKLAENPDAAGTEEIDVILDPCE